MDAGLKEKVVIVTGGASGIGRATAELLAHEGAIVMIADKDYVKGISLLESLKQQHKPAHFCEGDLTNEDKCKELVDYTIDTFSKIDILVNNAGEMISLILITRAFNSFENHSSEI